MSVKNIRIIRGIAFLAALLIVTSAFGEPLDTPDRSAEAARAAGCPQASGSFASAIGAWPGGTDGDLRIVASVSGETFHDTLGDLCVWLVTGPDFRPQIIAVLKPDLRLPSPDVEPISNIYMGVDKTPFRFRPGETAFGVRIESDLDTTSVSVSSTMLYLFRRDGGKLIEIFHGEVASGEIDKVGNEDSGVERIVKFSTTLHNGAFDLIVATKRGGKAKTYVWNGKRYGLAKAATR